LEDYQVIKFNICEVAEDLFTSMSIGLFDISATEAETTRRVIL